jgi:hypothetical protein
MKQREPETLGNALGLFPEARRQRRHENLAGGRETAGRRRSPSGSVCQFSFDLNCCNIGAVYRACHGLSSGTPVASVSEMTLVSRR